MDSRKLVLLLATCALLAVGGTWAALRGRGKVAGEGLSRAELEPPVQAERPAESGALPALDRTAGAEQPAVEREAVETSPVGVAGLVIPDDAYWIRGRVLFPHGAPSDPELRVVARGRRFGDEKGGEREHSVPVEADGSFRVACAKKTRKGYLEVVGRWLYLPSRVSFNLKDEPDDVLLEPELGGVMTGELSLPAAVAFDEDAFGGVQLHARLQRPGDLGRVQRTTQPDAEGRFEFIALPPGARYSVTADSGPYADSELTNLELRAGEELHVALALELGVDLIGHVMDENGAPVAEALIVAKIELGAFSVSSYNNNHGTDETGAFALRGLGAGDVSLIVSKDGYLEHKLALGELELGTLREGLAIVLERGSSLSGVVTWPDGRPARGAGIEITQASAERDWFSLDGDGYQAETDAEGRFHVQGLAAGPCAVIANAPAPKGDGEEQSGARGRSPDWIAVLEDVPAGSSGLALVLSSGHGLRGRVVDDTGAPLDDYRVFAAETNDSPFPFAGEPSVSRRYRDADGSFELSGLAPGAWQVYAAASGHADSAPLRFDAPHTGGEVELVVQRHGAISGHVVDPSGAPVHRARVTAVLENGQRRNPWSGDQDTTGGTNADGAFRLRRVPPGKLTLTAKHDEHGDSEPAALELAPAGEIGGQTLVLRVPARLTVSVHPAAEPVAAREIKVRSPQGGEYDTLVTDASGRAELAGLSPGTYELTLEPLEEDDEAGIGSWLLRQSRQAKATVELLPGEHASVVIGAPSERSIRVQGRLTEAGRPVPDTLVALMLRERATEDITATHTDAEGRFTVELAEPGGYGATIGSEYGQQVWIEFEVPDTSEHTLELALPTCVARGSVRTADGAPATDCAVTLQRTEGAVPSLTWAAMRRVTTDEQGRFEFKHLAAGPYALTAGGSNPWGRRRGTAPGTARRDLTLTEGDALEGLELVLGEPARLRGTVLGPAGQPAVGAQLSVDWPTGGSVSPFPWWQTDAGGQFDIDGLPPGRVHVKATSSDGLSSATHEVELAEGGTSTIELVIEND